MVDHRKSLARSTLHVFYILPSCTIYDAQTRFGHLFFWSPVTCSCNRYHGYIDCLPRTTHPHTQYRGNSISGHITYSLHTYYETKYLSKISLSPPPRLSRTPRNIWWRCLGNMTRTNCHHSQLYSRIHHTIAHSALCSSLICSRYL